jgi:hypothetical protein
MNLRRLLITAAKFELCRMARPSASQVWRMALMVLLLAALLPTTHAQVSASVKGIVTDASGAAVPRRDSYHKEYRDGRDSQQCHGRFREIPGAGAGGWRV